MIIIGYWRIGPAVSFTRILTWKFSVIRCYSSSVMSKILKAVLFLLIKTVTFLRVPLPYNICCWWVSMSVMSCIVFVKSWVLFSVQWPAILTEVPFPSGMICIWSKWTAWSIMYVKYVYYTRMCTHSHACTHVYT